MNLSEEEKEQADNYVLDVTSTIHSNIVNIIALPLIYGFLSLFGRMVNNFTNPEMQIIISFVWAYVAIKLFVAALHINLEYKPREANTQQDTS